ncbi:MAG TPA: hypothetical protein VGQ57_19855, partial [Polyangiaceae bacterium]|nr:hypothetical protein [Polyangiaceae bacterium]
MKLRSSFVSQALALVVLSLVVLFAPPARATGGDDIEMIPEGTTTPAPAPPPRGRRRGAPAPAAPAPAAPAPAPAPAPEPAPPPPPPPPPPPSEPEIRGMHCTPDVKEVEVRRPIPISCSVEYPVSGVELRYRTEAGSEKWEKLELSHGENTYTGTIPCGVTNTPGSLKFYIFARNENNKVVARVGRRETPFSIRVVEHSNAHPPALPGQKPPQRCYEPNECPAELVGTQVCPGTHVAKSAKKGWGATCSLTSECSGGLECIKGSCDEPTKCDDSKDCSEGGECIDGKCHVADAEELKSEIGPAKHHWIGIHFGADFLIAGAGSGVCGPDSAGADAQKWNCFDGGNEYAGLPNTSYSGHVGSSFYVATLRALLSYDYMFGRFSVGGRLGWAFRGAPKGFSPIHIEVRAAYSLLKEPFKRSFRPYLGFSFGHAEVDASSKTTIVDC